MMSFTKTTFLGLLLSFSFVLQAQAQTDGAALYAAKGCLACHGVDGNTPLTPTYPKLAGQNSEYTYNQLIDFKNSARINGQGAIMVGIVAAVTEDEMQKIAEYLSSSPEKPAAEPSASEEAAPEVDAGDNTLYVEKACIACHGEGGNIPAMNAYPKIAGQTEMYLLAQMKDIKSGTRANSHAVAMTNIMNTVSDEEMASLAKWLSVQGR